MNLSRRTLIASVALLPALPFRRARAQGTTLRIGVLTDLSGIYQDNSGKTSVACALQAVAEFASSNGLQAAGDRRRPSEQGGYRGRHRAAMVRPRQCRRGDGRAELHRGAGGVVGVPREGRGVHRVPGRQHGADGHSMLAEHAAMDL